MMTAMGTIASQQASVTEATVWVVTNLLDYCVMHPDAVVHFHASDMVLHIKSDERNLSETKS